MRRVLPVFAAVLLLLAPVSVRAEDELPLPVAIECPASVSIGGAMRIPDEAPADCIYPGALPMPVAGDPCAPDQEGAIPEACLSGPGDSIESCWITSDGVTNCPDASASPEVASHSFEIVSVSAGGPPIVVSGRLALFDATGRLSATVGCNSIGGDAKMGAAGAIEVGELFMTEIYCDDLADAESALLAVLAGDELRLESDRLSSSAGSLELRAIAMTGAKAAGETTPGLLLALAIAVALGALLVVRRGNR